MPAAANAGVGGRAAPARSGAKPTRSISRTRTVRAHRQVAQAQRPAGSTRAARRRPRRSRSRGRGRRRERARRVRASRRAGGAGRGRWRSPRRAPAAQTPPIAIAMPARPAAGAARIDGERGGERHEVGDRVARREVVGAGEREQQRQRDRGDADRGGDGDRRPLGGAYARRAAGEQRQRRERRAGRSPAAGRGRARRRWRRAGSSPGSGSGADPRAQRPIHCVPWPACEIAHGTSGAPHTATTATATTAGVAFARARRHVASGRGGVPRRGAAAAPRERSGRPRTVREQREDRGGRPPRERGGGPQATGAQQHEQGQPADQRVQAVGAGLLRIPDEQRVDGDERRRADRGAARAELARRSPSRRRPARCRTAPTAAAGRRRRCRTRA